MRFTVSNKAKSDGFHLLCAVSDDKSVHYATLGTIADLEGSKIISDVSPRLDRSKWLVVVVPAEDADGPPSEELIRASGVLHDTKEDAKKAAIVMFGGEETDSETV